MGVYIEISCDRCSTDRGHITYIAGQGWLCPSCLAIDSMPRGKDGLIVGDRIETAIWSNAPASA